MSKFRKYSEYKEVKNYIGSVPSEWKIDKLKVILQERNKKNKPIISKERLSLSIDKGVTLYAEKTTNLDRFKDDFSQYKIAYPKDLVLNSMNVIVGAAGVSKYFGCVSPAYYVLYSSDETKYLADYFYYFFKTSKMQKKLYSIGRGIMAIDRGNDRVNTCRLKVAKNDLKSLIFPIPSIKEQHKIVDFIKFKEKQINKLINKQKKLIELLEEKKKIIITEAVTKGLDKSVPMKDSGVDYIGHIPQNWEVGKVKQYYKIITGFTPDTTQIGYYDDINGQNWVTISDICGKYTPDSTNRKISEKFIKLKHPRQTPKGSLLYSFKLSVGHVTFAKENIYTNEAIASFLDSDKCCLPFLFYSSYLIVNNANENIYCAKILNQKLIKNAFIVFPPLNEQKFISGYLDKKCELIEKIINNKNALISKLKEYKNTLISNAVTGQIDVRDYEIPATINNIDLEEFENISEDDKETLNEVEYANN